MLALTGRLFGDKMKPANSTASAAPKVMQRPLSPHLGIYKPMPTMVMSILHRLTGAALYFGTILLAAWLIAAATSVETFGWMSWFFSSWIGRIVLFGYTWALMHHMLGGVRHFVWDVGLGLDKHFATKMALASAAGSIALTLLIWAFALIAL
jgi:succinate dehydrogenase / fumarate reductase, cytochrome b subunit